MKMVCVSRSGRDRYVVMLCKPKLCPGDLLRWERVTDLCTFDAQGSAIRNGRRLAAEYGALFCSWNRDDTSILLDPFRYAVLLAQLKSEQEESSCSESPLFTQE